VRFTALTTVALANQQGAFAELTQFMSDHDDRYPYYATPGTHEAVLEWNGQQMDDRYWTQPRLWGLYLHSLGYDGWLSLGPDAHARSYEELRDDAECAGCGPGYVSMHALTNTVFAEPDFWIETTEADKRYHRGMRGTQVRHPSLKGIVIMRVFGDPNDPRVRTLMHFADGHGEIVSFADLEPGVARGGVEFSGWPGFSTVRGVHGRDR
jgi:hypothetical protein